MALSNPSFNEKTVAAEAVSALKGSIAGKNILIVGASFDTLGGEFLSYIAPYPKSVTLLGRSKTKMQEAVDHAFRPLGPNAHRPTIRLVEVDMISFESVRKAAAEVNADQQPIDLLMLSQGIRRRPEPTYGPDGFELVFTGNHLASFLLTSLLLPRLRQAGPGARAVTISSAAHAIAQFRWDDPNYKLRPEEWDGQNAYGQSKIANALFIKSLAKKLAAEKITAIALHPGLIDTASVKLIPDSVFIQLGVKTPDGEYTPMHKKYSRTMEQGIATLLVAAFDPVLRDHSGEWIEDCQIHNDRVAPFVNDENAEKLWFMTEEMTGHKFF
ncbi:NAD(P)-binding protein [Clavulina sp. PMI_390]|nr:NAD(P)-binding protein [Clavulina sp. PMI_390]